MTLNCFIKEYSLTVTNQPPYLHYCRMASIKMWVYSGYFHEEYEITDGLRMTNTKPRFQYLRNSETVSGIKAIQRRHYNDYQISSGKATKSRYPGLTNYRDREECGSSNKLDIMQNPLHLLVGCDCSYRAFCQENLRKVTPHNVYPLSFL